MEEGAGYLQCDDCGANLAGIENTLVLEEGSTACPTCGLPLPKNAAVCPRCLGVADGVLTELFFPFDFEDSLPAKEKASLSYRLLRRRVGRTHEAQLIYARAYLETLSRELLPGAINSNTGNELLRGYRLFTGLTRLLETVELLSDDPEHRDDARALLVACDSIYPKILAILLCHTKLLGALPLAHHGVFAAKDGWAWAKLRNKLVEQACAPQSTTGPLAWGIVFLRWREAKAPFNPFAEMMLAANKAPTYAISEVGCILDEAVRLDPAAEAFIREFAAALGEAVPEIPTKNRDELRQLLDTRKQTAKVE
jgi:hypothetical protein